MVFRRKAKAKRSYGRMKAKSHKSAGGLGLTDLLIGGALYGFARPMVANMLPNLFTFGPVDSDNALIAGAGYFGMKSSNKIIKALSMSAIVGETAIVTSRVAQGTGGTSNGGQLYG